MVTFLTKMACFTFWAYMRSMTSPRSMQSISTLSVGDDGDAIGPSEAPLVAAAAVVVVVVPLLLPLEESK